MCKIAVIPKIINWEKTKRLIDALVTPMTASDSDGFGWMGTNGKTIVGERWLNVKDAFKKRLSIERSIQAQSYAETLTTSEKYQAFGNAEMLLKSGKIKSIALHARMSTNSVSLENTHPFFSEKSALIHNGVVERTGLTYLTSTCDSEGILNAYDDLGISENASNMQALAEKLSGYYACAAFSKVGDSILLDVFKCDTAQLIAADIGGVGLVFCTNLTILKKACKKARLSIAQVYKVKSGVLMRHDAATGKLLSQTIFTPKLYGGFGKKYRSAESYWENQVVMAKDNGIDIATDSATTSDDAPQAVDDYFKNPFAYKSGT